MLLTGCLSEADATSVESFPPLQATYVTVVRISSPTVLERPLVAVFSTAGCFEALKARRGTARQGGQRAEVSEISAPPLLTLRLLIVPPSLPRVPSLAFSSLAPSFQRVSTEAFPK